MHIILYLLAVFFHSYIYVSRRFVLPNLLTNHNIGLEAASANNKK